MSQGYCGQRKDNLRDDSCRLKASRYYNCSIKDITSQNWSYFHKPTYYICLKNKWLLCFFRKGQSNRGTIILHSPAAHSHFLFTVRCSIQLTGVKKIINTKDLLHMIALGQSVGRLGCWLSRLLRWNWLCSGGRSLHGRNREAKLEDVATSNTWTALRKPSLVRTVPLNDSYLWEGRLPCLAGHCPGARNQDGH